MHIEILDICLIWFLVVMGTESGKTFVVEVSLHGVDSSDKYIESQVKFLFVENQRVIYISLHQKLVMKCGFRQIGKLFKEDNSITASTLRRLSDERLSRILSHVMLKIPDLIW